MCLIVLLTLFTCTFKIHMTVHGRDLYQCLRCFVVIFVCFFLCFELCSLCQSLLLTVFPKSTLVLAELSFSRLFLLLCVAVCSSLLLSLWFLSPSFPLHLFVSSLVVCLVSYSTIVVVFHYPATLDICTLFLPYALPISRLLTLLVYSFLSYSFFCLLPPV